MADYYPLLKRAIGSLDRPDERTRYDVYERARKALLHQLEVSGAAEAEVNLQLEAIGAAVARIEREIAQPSRPPPVALRSAPPRRDRPPPEPQFEASANPAAVLQQRPTALFVVAGVLVGIVLAGLSYYFLVHDRSRTAPTPRAEAPRPAAPAKTTASGPAQTVDVDNASYMLRRQRIFYRTTHPPGTIVVSRSQRFLYLVQPNQVAIRYAIGTGPECENIAGLFRITEKLSVKDPAAVPSATPPPPFRLGEQFGPRAVYFDSTRAVHGTAQPHQIGQSAPVGCFLSWTPDIVDLYDRVQLNDRVVVTN